MKKFQSHYSSFRSLVNRQAAALLVAGATLVSAEAGPLVDLYYGYYTPITGNAVTNLTLDPTYPASPDNYDVITAGLTAPANISDNYGRLIRGYVEAPKSGSYVFWIASDDDSELWLSTNYDPSGKVKIAENIGAVGSHDYYAKPGQKSAPVSLVAGQKYYFEVLHKEGVGNDFVSVMWQLPDGTTQDPVPENRLWPFPVDTSTLPTYTAAPLTEGPVILSTYAGGTVDVLPTTTTVQDGEPADLTVAADGTQPIYVQWYSNGVALPNGNLLTYHLDRASAGMNGSVYSVVMTNASGSANASTTLAITPDSTPVTLVDALSFANAAGDVAVVFSEPVDPVTATLIGNYTISGGIGITGARMSSNPSTVLLKTSGLVTGTAYTVTASNVRDLASTPNVIAPNSTVPVEQSLTTWYRLDESGGTTAVDSSGKGLNGTMFNDVMPGYAGKVLKALKFAGVTGGYVQLPNGFEDATTNGFTVALWAYPTTQGAIANWNRFIDFGNGPATDNILFARTGGGQSVTFEVYNGGVSGGKVTTADGTLFINQWQHLAATLDGAGNVVVYRNGIALTNGNTTPPAVLTRTNCYLGRSNWAGDDYYAGKLDDVRIYNRVLSPAAVLALANGGGPDDTDTNVPPVSVVATTPVTALRNSPPGVFTITRAGSTNSPLSVSYAVGGTATNGVNYTALAGSVVIPAGTNSVRVLVSPVDFSFKDLALTVVLTVSPNANYAVADADSGTVTIQNNDVSPSATLASADNPIGAVTTTTVDVWFAAPVVNPSATTLANYVLQNASGVTITNASLGAHGLRVVLGASAPIPQGAQLSVSGVQDGGGNSSPSQIPIRVRLSNPVNIVSDVYHGAAGDRPTAFAHATDGVVNNSNNGGTGFDTYKLAGTQFAGLLYGMSQDLQTIKVDLGQQFGDGGSWASPPSVYLLTNAVDTGSTRPESNTNWTKVNAPIISGSVFDAAGDANPSPNTPIVFDLTGLPSAQRTCFGWAVGGALGDGANQFISISELRGYGVQGTNNSIIIVHQPTNITVTAGQVATFLQQSTDAIAPLAYQWLEDGTNLAGSTDVNLNLRPAMQTDSGASFSVVVSTVPFSASLTSQVATLTVLARTTPPAVLDAVYDPSNSVVEVWFDEALEPNSAQNMGNYAINDPGLTLSSLSAFDAQSRRVVLAVTGAPSSANPTVTVTNVQDLFGFTMTSQSVPLLTLVASPVRVVANQYQQGRAAAYSRSTDGVVQYDANVTTWTTFGGPTGLSDFVGVGYAEPQVFGVLKVDLGWQFGDGGDWALRPRVFLQKTPVDTNQRAPETDPADWVEVPAQLMSGNIFNFAADGPGNTVPVNTPIVFDLSSLPLSQRTAYGWAIGGVQGNSSGPQFVSISELRGYGQLAGTLTNTTGAPQLAMDVAPLLQSLPGGFPMTYAVVATGTQPLHYQWFFNGVAVVDNNRLSGAHSSVLSFAETLPNDSGTYQVVVTNSAGAVTSSVASVTFTRIALNQGGGWTPNAGAVIAGNSVMLTDGGGGEANSTFLNYPVYVGAFTATWTYQDVGGGGADGTVFAIQNGPLGASEVGGGGGGLGFSGITPSVGLEFNIYGPNTPGIALRVNGATGGPYTATTPVNVASGNPIAVTLRYDGTTAALLLTDLMAHVSFTANLPADVVGTLGTNTAYVGFTGASGGVASKQIVSNFSFYNQPPLTAQTGAGGVLSLSWSATSAGFELQRSSSLAPGGWTPVSGPVDLVNGQNQAVVTPAAGNQFYRLALP